MRALRWPETPLLLKDLSELAARRRTYVVRFLYALGLFGSGLVVLFAGATNSDVVLGMGHSLFRTLVGLEHVAIFILVPAMTASALTIEKERETLQLLLITRLSAPEIILEKFLSRVVPVLSYVMLSFPLLAVAYSYGGVTTQDLVVACASLVAAVIYQSAFSLLCSAYFRTTVEAIVVSFVGQGALSLATCGFVPFGPVSGQAAVIASPGEAVARLIWLGFVSVVCLLLSMEFLHRRAFVPSRNVLLQLFQWLDRYFNEWNKVTGGVVLVRDGDPLPGDRPVAWRETSKRSLGTFRFLVRVLIVVELPVLFVSQLVNIEMVRGHSAMTYLWYALWVGSTALICLHAANVVTAERARQTLDVLLSTPLSGRELVIEKLAGVRRLLAVLTIPFLTIALFEHWFRDYKWDLSYLTESLIMAAVFGWTLGWLAFRIGLATKNSLAGMVASCGAVFALCGLPWLGSYVARLSLTGRPVAVIVAATSLNPATLILMVEDISAESLRFQYGWTVTTFPWGFGGAMLGYLIFGIWLRRHCLVRSDRLLGRAGPARRAGSGRAAPIDTGAQRLTPGEKQPEPLPG